MHMHMQQKHRDSTLRQHTNAHTHAHTHTTETQRQHTTTQHTHTDTHAHTHVHATETERQHTTTRHTHTYIHTHTHTRDRKKETAHYDTTQIVKNWQGSIRNVHIGNTQITLHNTPAPVYIVNTTSQHTKSIHNHVRIRACVRVRATKAAAPSYLPPTSPPLVNHVHITLQKTSCVTQL